MNRKISMLEFGDKTGRLAGMLSVLSMQEGGGWGYLVDHMERMTGKEEYSMRLWKYWQRPCFGCDLLVCRFSPRLLDNLINWT